MRDSYFYVPFSEAEDSYSLEISAMNWRHAMSQELKRQLQDKSLTSEEMQSFKEKESKKIPIIVAHSQHDFKAIMPENQGGTLYVLGHGIPAEDERAMMICNTADPKATEVYLLTMEELVLRAKADGLKPGMFSKIKLYFCDETGKTQEMAKRFVKALGKEYAESNLSVDYYTAIITTPKQVAGLHRWAGKKTPTFYKTLNPADAIFLGRASENRQTISVKDEFNKSVTAKSQNQEIEPLSKTSANKPKKQKP